MIEDPFKVIDFPAKVIILYSLGGHRPALPDRRIWFNAQGQTKTYPLSAYHDRVRGAVFLRWNSLSLGVRTCRGCLPELQDP